MFRELYQKVRWSLMVLLGIGCLLAAQPEKPHAAGLLIADGGFGGVLEIKEHDVRVTINNGVAVTQVTQVFLNTENRQVEALYTFPVPKGASVANFSMWINGKEMVGEVLEKARAREIYNSYKQQRRDPGLLEQVDYKTFEMRIFPINAGAEQRVQISYYQELEVDHDRATYVYPLATVTREDLYARSAGNFAMDVRVKSAIALTDVASPSHAEQFEIARHSPTFCQASLETNGGGLDADVVLSYQLERPRTGLDLITSRQDREDGFFMLTLTSGPELSAREAGMDYLFLLDISGSMAHDGKLLLSKNSVDAFVDQLDREDRFELMTFNVRPVTLFGQLTPGDEENKARAAEFMGSQRAKGGTVLAPAMTGAYRYADPDRTLNVVILSDGMTEQKERQELLGLIQSRPANTRVFCIGVGNEVNRPLLRQLAEDSGGLAAFISRGDNFKRQAQAFRRKLMRPVATDLKLNFDGIQVYDVEPRQLPNLFHGAPIRIYGRYQGEGQAEVTLTGNIQGESMAQSVALGFPARDEANPEIERMWALKRVDEIQKTINRKGSSQVLLDEIIGLGEGFSIVTEYTSFLVLENDAEYQRWKIERRNRTRIARDRQAQAARDQHLAQLRDKALAQLGPQPDQPVTLAKATVPQAKSVPKATPTVPQAAQPQPSSDQSRDFSFGSAPVGPLFVGLAYWLTRRRKRN